MDESRVGDRIRLFCFPYGGAGASCYYGWQASLPHQVDVAAVEYPGRDGRWAEAACFSVDELAEDFLRQEGASCEGRFALFGHSLGALVGFEATRILRDRGQPLPEVLFVSGSPAPHIPRSRPMISHLPKQEFLETLVREFDISKALLEDSTVAEIVYPILRADFQVVEGYKYNDMAPLDCSIVALGGTQDAEASEASVSAWRRQTNAGFELCLIEGGHFFISEKQAQVLSVVARGLKTVG